MALCFHSFNIHKYACTLPRTQSHLYLWVSVSCGCVCEFLTPHSANRTLWSSDQCLPAIPWSRLQHFLLWPPVFGIASPWKWSQPAVWIPVNGVWRHICTDGPFMDVCVLFLTSDSVLTLIVDLCLWPVKHFVTFALERCCINQLDLALPESIVTVYSYICTTMMSTVL